MPGASTLRRRSILLVGKSGLGKSSFNNELCGANNPTSDGSYSCTTVPLESALAGDFTGYPRVWDFPGTGDVPQGRTPLLNTDIFRMIVEKALTDDVVGIVFFVSQGDVLSTRHDQSAYELAQMLDKRFTNWRAIVQFALSGSDVTYTSTEQLITALAKKNRLDKFTEIGASFNNVFVCCDLDFEDLKKKCLKCFQRENAAVLNAQQYRLQCTVCKVIGDPLLVASECRSHGATGTPQHPGPWTGYHPRELQWMHTQGIKSGSFPNCTSRVYACCGGNLGSNGCDKLYGCCQKDNSDGCQKRCNQCLRDLDELGCVGTCKNCDQPFTAAGCIAAPAHKFEVLGDM